MRWHLTLIPSIMWFTMICDSTQSAPPPKLSKWLGPQVSFVRPQKTFDRRGLKDVEVNVVLGKDISIDRRSYVVTLKNGTVQKTGLEEVALKMNAKYVWGRVRYEKNRTAIYSLDVKISGGKLDGAIVHLRDDLIPDLGNEPADFCDCVYEIPEEIDVEIGDLDTEIVKLVVK